MPRPLHAATATRRPDPNPDDHDPENPNRERLDYLFDVRPSTSGPRSRLDVSTMIDGLTFVGGYAAGIVTAIVVVGMMIPDPREYRARVRHPTALPKTRPYPEDAVPKTRAPTRAGVERVIVIRGDDDLSWIERE